jgi:hypothetical protein
VSRPRSSSGAFAVFMAAVAALFLVQQFGRGTSLFSGALAHSAIRVLASLSKLTPQLLGSIFGALCAIRHAKEDAARRAWFLVSAWLGSWFVGQLVLAIYERFLRMPAPLPSLGDLFFGVGYACVILALFAFVKAYRRSGFAPGSAREDALIALGACATVGVVGCVILWPVALAPTPLGARIVNVGYPLLDLVTLIPALVLLRITIGFRGGRVWRVWAALLAGILFATGGDVVFADLTPAHIDTLGPLADLLFCLGYSFCAYGTRLQYELVAD